MSYNIAYIKSVYIYRSLCLTAIAVNESVRKQHPAEVFNGLGDIIGTILFSFRSIAVAVASVNDGKAQFVSADDIEFTVADHDCFPFLNGSDAF